MVGFPDYDTYLEHMRRTHPGAAVMHDLPGILPRTAERPLWHRRAQGVSVLLTLTRS